MADVDYDEVVTLLTPGSAVMMTLADAIFEVMRWPDRLRRMKASIVRDGGPLLDLGEIEEIYGRPDFPMPSGGSAS